MAPAAAAGRRKSNIPILASPMSWATDTTSRFVDVPMTVDVPPMIVANPMGINTEDAGVPVCSDTLIRIGRNSTTTGVLLTKALTAAVRIRVSSRERLGLTFQSRDRSRPIGSSAPVRTRPCPAIINAQTEIKASCPKPRKKSVACRICPFERKGKSSNPTVRPVRISRLVVSTGSSLRLKRISARTMDAKTVSAWTFGGLGKVIAGLQYSGESSRLTRAAAHALRPGRRSGAAPTGAAHRCLRRSPS